VWTASPRCENERVELVATLAVLKGAARAICAGAVERVGLQAQRFYAGAFSETDLTGGGFGDQGGREVAPFFKHAAAYVGIAASAHQARGDAYAKQ
jgi:hypothetical protein